MLLELLLAFWAAIAVSVYWIDYARIPDKIPWLNRKPFNCAACLPFWLVAAFLIPAIYGCELLTLLATACTAGIVAPWIIKQLSK